jgi:predicted HTH transcriptional regulator
LPPEPEPIEHSPEPPSAVAPVQTSILHAAREILVKARVATQDRKRKKRDKIMQALNTKSKITNDEVEKLLHVSDATATRYLSALEKEGKIIQVGKDGRGILYIKTP